MKTSLEFTINNVSDIRRIVDALDREESGESLVDLSMGCQHIRDCADEMGEEWETYHSNHHQFLLNGRECDSYYDENGSIFSCWNVWAKGIGNGRGASLEEALYSLYRKMEAS